MDLLPKNAEAKQELLKYLLSVSLTKQSVQGKTLLESLKSDNQVRDQMFGHLIKPEKAPRPEESHSMF